MTKIVDDNYMMPFGKYKGDPIGTVPAEYLDWLRGEDWVHGRWPEVWAYMADNAEHISRELEEKWSD